MVRVSHSAHDSNMTKKCLRDRQLVFWNEWHQKVLELWGQHVAIEDAPLATRLTPKVFQGSASHPIVTLGGQAGLLGDKEG
jgi:hypothetical protein